MKYLCVLVFIFTLSSSHQLSACELIVKVQNFKNKPEPAQVYILDEANKIVHSGGTTEVDGVTNGEARFCDLALETPYFGVLVGNDGCGQVLVRRLIHPWGDRREITVHYENCHRSFVFPVSGCPVLFKVRDSLGLPLHGARLITKNMTEPAKRSSRFGLIYSYMNTGTTLDATIKYGNYDRPLNLECEGRLIVREVVF